MRRKLDTTEGSLVLRLNGGSRGLDLLCSSSSWIYLHVVTDEFPGRKKATRAEQVSLATYRFFLFCARYVLFRRFRYNRWPLKRV